MRALSKAHRAQISKGMIGMKRGPMSAVHKAAISKKMKSKGLTRDQDVRRKIGDAQWGKAKSPETREKIAAAQPARWQVRKSSLDNPLG